MDPHYEMSTEASSVEGHKDSCQLEHRSCDTGIVQPAESFGAPSIRFSILKVNYKNDEIVFFTKVHGGRTASAVIWEAVNMY